MGSFERRQDFWRSLPAGLEIAELGVYDGAHAREIHELASPSLLHLVDPWAGVWPSGDQDGENMRHLDLEASLRSVAWWAKGKRVAIWRGGSLEWLASRPSRSLDVVYLDSLHHFEHVLAELLTALPRMRPGGWLCGHDHDAGRFPGVVRAVAEFRRVEPDAEAHFTTRDGLASYFLRLPS